MSGMRKPWEEWRISWIGLLGGSGWQKVREADNLRKRFLNSALASFPGVTSGQSFLALSLPKSATAAAACTASCKMSGSQHLCPSGVTNGGKPMDRPMAPSIHSSSCPPNSQDCWIIILRDCLFLVMLFPKSLKVKHWIKANSTQGGSRVVL